MYIEATPGQIKLERIYRTAYGEIPYTPGRSDKWHQDQIFQNYLCDGGAPYGFRATQDILDKLRALS